MRPLSLHHTSAIDVSLLELLALASKNNCRGVCIFTQFDHPTLKWPVLHASETREFLTQMQGLGLVVSNIEVFYVQPNMTGAWERFKSSFEVGQALGAKRAVVHVTDKDFNRAAENFGKFCEFAALYNISLGLEFWKLSSGCTTRLDDALRLLRYANKSNAGFALDVLHLMRTDTRPADIKELDRKWISYGQLNDGRLTAPDDLFEEAIFNRGVPGTGAFPLVDWVRAAPVDLPLDIEVPQDRLRRLGASASDRVAAAVAGARRVLEEAGPTFS